MASTKHFATIFVFSLLFAHSITTLTHACGTCTTQKCPRDALKLGVCADILGLAIIPGSPTSSKCCALLGGLVDLEAALCLCTAIKANVLGINLNVPVTLSLLLSACQKSIPPGFQC